MAFEDRVRPDFRTQVESRLGQVVPSEDTLRALYESYFDNRGVTTPDENAYLLVRAVLFAADHRISETRDREIFDEYSRAYYSKRKRPVELITTPFDLYGVDFENPRIEMHIEPAELEEHYSPLGMEFSVEEEGPETVFEPHAHDHDVRLLTLQGSVFIRQGENDWEDIRAGTEVYIPAGSEHEARVGEFGWKYVYARPTAREAESESDSG